MMGLDIYKKIFHIRATETKLDELFKKGLVHGTAHFCIGQEFIPATISQYLTNEDTVTSTHRGHGHALAKGLDVKLLLAEILGKSIGYNAGKGGSQHISSKDHNFYANGITGGMMPVANGMAFANKYKSNAAIVVTYLGDGTMNEGNALEALNLASVLKLPILFVCENNSYAMSTHVKKAVAGSIQDRVKGFGIAYEIIKENDFKKLDEVAKKVIDEMRKNPAPFFIEVQTYRHHGHSKNDQNLYRTKDEEKFWFERDVLIALEKELLESGTSKEELESFKKSCVEEIDRIAEEVSALPEENEEKILDHVYSK
jgi:acetoin:2,6-dichlorophenolindophenol oxidoreductase subunit alpha